MPEIKPNTAPTTARPSPAPSIRTSTPDPVEVKRLELRALVLEAMIRTERGLARWDGGNTQFEATRFMLGGKMDALRAILAALEGDIHVLKDL
jgi:hypothetical protein